MVARLARSGRWVLLTYRLPREPSTPRSSVWRKLRRLGVAQLADGLVALPADARTREQLEWIAEEVDSAGGTSMLWLAEPMTGVQEKELAGAMAAARSEEYDQIAAAAEASVDLPLAEQRRRLRRLRRELRSVRRRDYFPPLERQRAVAAVEQLARSCADVDEAEVVRP